MYEDKHHSMFFPYRSSRHLPSSDVSLKALLAFTHRSIFRASHVHRLGGSTELPDLLMCLPQRLAKTTQYVGGRLGNLSIAPLCRMKLVHSAWPKMRCTGPNAIDPRRSSSCVHACSPFHRPSRCMHVLQPFALPRHVIAFASRRTIHARRYDRLNRIAARAHGLSR